MQQFLITTGVLVIAAAVAAVAEVPHPANAVVREQWGCGEPAYWRIDRLKTETPQVVRDALGKEPTCRLLAKDIFLLTEVTAVAPVEMILPLSAATVEEAGYGVNLYLPMQFDTTAPMH